jgi:plastocyanin
MRGESMKRKLLILSAAAVVALGACGGGDDGGSESSDDSGGGSVTLTASNFAFDPSDLSAAAGDTIEFTNEDDAEHNFTAEDASLDEDVEAGGSTSISLEGVEAGDYDFFCEYHPDMKGTLTVE